MPAYRANANEACSVGEQIFSLAAFSRFQPVT